MLLHLAERLEIPLRERNVLLNAAGFAPVFPERPLDDPALHAARKAVDLILAGHEPYPALAVDRHWSMMAHNNAVLPLLSGVDSSLLKPPVNALRLSLHPLGLAPRIANLHQWRAHLFARLGRQIEVSGDLALIELMRELGDYPVPHGTDTDTPESVDDYAFVAVPFRLITDAGMLSFISTTTVFGTPIDITLSELALETFFPADSATADTLRNMASQQSD